MRVYQRRFFRGIALFWYDILLIFGTCSELFVGARNCFFWVLNSRINSPRMLPFHRSNFWLVHCFRIIPASGRIGIGKPDVGVRPAVGPEPRRRGEAAAAYPRRPSRANFSPRSMHRWREQRRLEHFLRALDTFFAGNAPVKKYPKSEF